MGFLGLSVFLESDPHCCYMQSQWSKFVSSCHGADADKALGGFMMLKMASGMRRS